jgi:glutathione S-transferase
MQSHLSRCICIYRADRPCADCGAATPQENIMKLYYSPGACSLSPHIVLKELGIPHEIEKADLKEKKTASGGDLFAVNPKGQVPALQLDDGAVLTEGPAIVQYLADKKPEAGLAPANGSMARYRLQEALNHLTADVHKNFSPLFNPATPAEYRETATKKLQKEFALLDKTLAKQPYLTGDKFTVADAYLFTLTNWAQPAKVDLSPYANVLAYRKRVGERPAVQAAMKAEGLVK